MKLTTTIVGMYPNAKVKYEGAFYDVEVIAKIGYIVLAGLHNWPDVSDCQLQLKPLSAISKEDSVECGVICGAEPLSPDATDTEIKDIAKLVGEGLQAIVGNPESEISIHLLDYLRSKSYDCGYLNTPSLIAAGPAVEM